MWKVLKCGAGEGWTSDRVRYEEVLHRVREEVLHRVREEVLHRVREEQQIIIQ
jgi:hypothetical protein